MTSEATILQANNLEYRQVPCSNASAWPAGTLMFFDSTGNVNHYTSALTGTAAVRYVAGILKHRKTASDGDTQVAVLTRGTVDFAIDGTVSAGQPVMAGAADNSVRAVDLTLTSAEQHGRQLGFADESGVAGDIIKIRVLLA